jgi:hypothetical protein
LPIHREEVASRRWSELANLVYQNARPSAAAWGGAPPGLRKSTRTIMPMIRIPTSVAGSTMLELEASLTDASGREADCELPPDPLPGGMLGKGVFPDVGTSGVTLVGTVVLGPTASGAPAMTARAVSAADFDVGV